MKITKLLNGSEISEMVKKKENYLICTRLIDTFPKKNNAILNFVSEAALSSFSNYFENKNYNINSSQWVDKKILLNDFNYIDNIYNELLPQIKECLNKIHGHKFSLRFWRILVGPWLGIFIFTLYDRWKNIESASKNFKIDKLIKLNFNEKNFVPYDNKDFLGFIQNDVWNQNLYQTMFDEFFNLNQIGVLNLESTKIEKLLKKFDVKPSPKSFLVKSIFKFFNIFSKKKYKYLLYSTYTGFWNEIKLSFYFNQLPIFIFKIDKYKTEKKINSEIRGRMFLNFNEKDKFKNFLLKSISMQMPKVFIENFNDLEKFSSLENLPASPEKIVTANALWFDSFFTYHVAKLTEKNSKIIYIQHGGAYGISKYSWPEEHEKNISDKYLTWGWKDEKFKSKTKRFYVILKKKKFSWNEKKMKNLLILMRPRKAYFQTPETSSVGIEPYSNYIKFCEKFLTSVSNKIKSETVLRFPFKNIRRESFDLFSKLKNYKVDNKGSFEEACNNSKIIINTANSTTFCETISNNIPSILVIDKNTPIRENILPIINNLELNNLLFFDPFKAGNFINEIWDNDIKQWWFKSETQNTLNFFREHLARPSKDIALDLAKEINLDI